MPLIMQGNWTVSVKENKAAFPQQFIISGASQGNGTYHVPHAPVVVTGTVWSVRIQSNPGGSVWADSEYQITFPVVSAGQCQFDLQSNDVWPGDKDFNDLVLTFSAPVTETDFLVYGHVSAYSGCWYNPCFPRYILIESAQALARARQFPALRDAIDKLYPTRQSLVRIPLPDPPPELPVGLLAGVAFKPLLIPVQGETATPVKKARVLKRVAAARKAGAAKTADSDAETSAVAIGTVELAKPASNLAAMDQVALGKLLDHGVRNCQVDALVNAGLRFQEYDRTDAEVAGGVYTGEGFREDLGQASTDRNGNYIFRFHRTLAQMIDESNTDVAPGEDEVLQAMPDLIVQVLGATSPGGTQYETAPYWNIPVLKRLNICIPSSYWPYPTTGCHGRPISHIGFIPVGKPSTVTLDADGLVTCTDTSKIDIPQTSCAGWWGALRMSACIGKYDLTPNYTLEYRARRPNGTWTNWQIYQEALTLDHWNSILGDWVGTKVGPFTHNLELTKGSPKVDVLAYSNIQGNMDWAGTDWFIKAIIPSWLYSYQGGPGSVEFRLKAYGPDGKQLQLWNDPVTALPLFSDTIRLFIDHTGPELNFKDVTIATPVPNPCPLFSLTPAELVSATLDLKFTAVQRQGLLNNYTLSVTKCNAPGFPVEDLPATGHPLQVDYLAASPCAGQFGTLFGEDSAAAVDDYVALHLNPVGTRPWLDPGETLSSFTLNLSAVVRRTDGHSYYPGYGPIQYNLVIQRAP
jgi:hypothetical protein